MQVGKTIQHTILGLRLTERQDLGLKHYSAEQDGSVLPGCGQISAWMKIWSWFNN